MTAPAALRRKLLWLIGGRAGVITLLLGSAILIQLKSPGSFPIDPFFALIGLTYALTVVWTLTLRVRRSGTRGWSTCRWRATR